MTLGDLVVLVEGWLFLLLPAGLQQLFLAVFLMGGKRKKKHFCLRGQGGQVKPLCTATV